MWIALAGSLISGVLGQDKAAQEARAAEAEAAARQQTEVYLMAGGLAVAGLAAVIFMRGRR